MEKFENTQQKNMMDEDLDLDQVSGGVKDIPQDQLFVDATKIDLHDTSFLSEKK